MVTESLVKGIRDVPDFPKKGIIFKDITPLLLNKNLFKEAIEQMSEKAKTFEPEVIASMEARGFIFGAALAHALGIGFIPIRKKGKLPYKTISEEYKLEYGTDILEIHQDALANGAKCLIVDDVLATGGTAEAVWNLVKKAGGKPLGFLFLIELGFLKGREKIEKYGKVSSLITF